MSTATDKLVESFAAMVKHHGVPIRDENNESRLGMFEEKLPKRLPQSFASFLSRYSFPAFDVVGISLFAWDSDSNPYTQEAAAAKGSLSELLLPAGYVQIGRPDTGDFDAICFDMNEQRQNQEYRIVQVDHEDILCNWKVRVSGERWPSFTKLIDSALSCADPHVYWEEPIV
jgi:hypothetical protein